MLDTFDGMNVFEENLQWAGSAGLYDAWKYDPPTHFTATGTRGVSSIKDGDEWDGVNNRRPTRHPGKQS